MATLARTSVEQGVAFRQRRFPQAPPAAQTVFDLLVAAALEEPDEPRRRAPSIALDGTPPVLSGGPGGAVTPLRLLVDPGGLARDVPEQADFALAVLGTLLGQLDWRAAAGDVNAIVAAVLPPSAEEARTLRGGAWLGLSCGLDVLELRLYLDLRRGPMGARWGRVGRAFRGLGDGETLAALCALAERIAPHVEPVGLGTVVADGAVRGLRLYAGLRAPDAASLAAVGAHDATALCRALGPFAAQSVTVGFDFGVRDGVLRGPGRTKVDVACLDRDPGDTLTAIAQLAGAAGLDRAAVPALLDDVDGCFGGAQLQYASFAPGQITAYVQPG